MVYGKQHYRTFDGSHFDLAGLCSYILAQDVVDRNFTIVQKYSGGPRRLSRDSLVVMLDGKTFELFPDNMVCLKLEIFIASDKRSIQISIFLIFFQRNIL